jgi:hypothetical protein
VGYEPEGIAYYKGYLFVANSGGYAASESHDYETTVSIIKADTMEKVRDVDTHQINMYGDMSISGKYLCINSPGDYYYVSAATIIFDCDLALSGSDDCFVKLDKASSYNCTATDGQFYAIGSRYSYITSKYTFDYITIDPKEAMDSEGYAGVTESLPGTVMSDIQSMEMPYSIYVNPYTGYIYATDAASFVEGGQLYQWSPSGTLLGKYNVYINPGHLLALPPNGEFNGVDEIIQSDEPKNDIIYNMQGMRIQNPIKGEMYIKNGKKIIY